MSCMLLASSVSRSSGSGRTLCSVGRLMAIISLHTRGRSKIRTTRPAFRLGTDALCVRYRSHSLAEGYVVMAGLGSGTQGRSSPGDHVPVEFEGNCISEANLFSSYAG